MLGEEEWEWLGWVKLSGYVGIWAGGGFMDI